MEIKANIARITYQPNLCKNLTEYSFEEVKRRFPKDGAFLLKLDPINKIAISVWKSPKRTRTYPLARVYDTLNFHGKKVTIIPIFKDEGFDGDRDFLQWDSVSLMSLLDVYVIISYYDKAVKSARYKDKITGQSLNVKHIENNLSELLKFRSSALHWNLAKIDLAPEVAQTALTAYEAISKNVNVRMHSSSSIQNIIDDLKNKKIEFSDYSRNLAIKAQLREAHVLHEKENISGEKATIVIKNFLGGHYYLTCDEYMIQGNKITLTEAKNSKKSVVPALSDIKDGLLKMMLFSNLVDVFADDRKYVCAALLKLTSSVNKPLSSRQIELLAQLKNESGENNFKITFNGTLLENLKL